MYEHLSYRDRAFQDLSQEFPHLSVRVVLSVFLRYLEHGYPTMQAVEATRERILDACAVPA